MQGDAEMAAKRLEALRDFTLLPLNKDVKDLAAQFQARSNLRCLVGSASSVSPFLCE